MMGSQQTVVYYKALIEAVATQEYLRLVEVLGSDVAGEAFFRRIVKIAALTVHVLLQVSPRQSININFLAQHIRRVIRRELFPIYSKITIIPELMFS